MAVLTGHLLKDPDYVSNYHRGTLTFDSKAKDGVVIPGAFRNEPKRVAANKRAILEELRRNNS